ncbi:MFS transporter [Burkholderia gladioli]|uniref:Shikimate transporter n=1 Tax=Burkholderia gladioli (strain BSR3) TaxID=999541 RepID=F2LMC8_BURGS|nr:MFS transporter [Burkholderia gladioli]AEA64212.1 shikimate transporter [Burkholderia gladioli BSR3]MBW5286951.1 MFS transporter [Burkholderia gladioli]
MTTAIAAHDRSADAAAGADLRKRAFAVGIGNFMEWFDFAIYGYFAAIIGKTFFPSAAPGVSLLSALAVFAVGFLSRPLGAVVLGPIGDRLGRRAVLIVTVFGMGVSTTLIGLLPGYAAIGLAAPVLLVVLRFLQGMMVGGEWSSAGIYIVESAPRTRRALAASVITGTAGAAFLVGTFIAALLSMLLSELQLATWGWRLPFVASVFMTLVAIYIRRRLGDTPVYEEVQRKRALHGVDAVPRGERMRAMLTTFAFSALFGVSLYYFITYANNHLTQTVGLSKTASLWLCSLALLLYTLFQPLVGLLSDRIGRRPLVLASALGLTLLAYAQGTEIYCAPTADDRASWAPSMIHIALEGRVHVLSACQAIRLDAYPAFFRDDFHLEAGEADYIMHGGSMIVDPLGKVLAGPVFDTETILYAEIDTGVGRASNLDFDVVGHYSRPDIFHLSVNTAPMPPVRFSAE